MKKDDLELEDDLEPEYDLKSLKVRKMGAGRKNFAGATVKLDPDVAINSIPEQIIDRFFGM